MNGIDGGGNLTFREDTNMEQKDIGEQQSSKYVLSFTEIELQLLDNKEYRGYLPLVRNAKTLNGFFKVVLTNNFDTNIFDLMLVDSLSTLNFTIINHILFYFNQYFSFFAMNLLQILLISFISFIVNFVDDGCIIRSLNSIQFDAQKKLTKFSKKYSEFIQK